MIYCLSVFVVIALAFVNATSQEECDTCDDYPLWWFNACFTDTVVSDGKRKYRVVLEPFDTCCGFSEETTSPPPDTGTEDCSAYWKWSPYVTYKGNGTVIHYKNIAYTPKRESSNRAPDVSTIYWSVLGECKRGTDVRGCDPDANGIGAVGERRLCQCCEGCATRDGLLPKCLDDKSQADCYDTWCPTVDSTMDPDQCKKVVEEGQMGWWGKELGWSLKAWPERAMAPVVTIEHDKEFPLLSEMHLKLGFETYMLLSITVNVTNDEKCEALWPGGLSIHYSPSFKDIKGDTYFLYDEIKKLRDVGGDIVLTFGGMKDTEMSDHEACQRDKDLSAVYLDVIDFLNVSAINVYMDEQRAWGGNWNSGWWKRNLALAAIRDKKGTDFEMWYTLDGNAEHENEDLMANILSYPELCDRLIIHTANYTTTCGNPGCDPSEAEIHTLESIVDYLWYTGLDYGIAEEFGWYSRQDVFKTMGVLTWIGFGPQENEYMNMAAFTKSVIYWKTQVLSVYSQWSLNRDRVCPENGNLMVDCSGVPSQQDYEYAETLVLSY